MTSITVHHGDCLDVLRGMESESVDSVVTDPPYGLSDHRSEHIVEALRCWLSGEEYRHKAKGFMQKEWDNFPPGPEVWREVLRVLKPGGHAVVFAGTRTADLMGVALRIAGFEIRDSLQWITGQGFPKSLDVGKAIDKYGGAEVSWFGPWMREERQRRGITQKELARHFPSKTGGLTGCVANWELGFNLPTPEQFNKLCEVLELPFSRVEEAEREIVGRNERAKGWFTGQDGHDITAPATDAARKWSGFGTQLKPAHEPIILARRPLAEPTIAAQVLATGTGALNVDGCRVNPGTLVRGGGNGKANNGGRYGGGADYAGETPVVQPHDAGRFPPNILHDGSPEVLEAFGRFGERRGFSGGGPHEGLTPKRRIGATGLKNKAELCYHADTGTAARFFPALGFTDDELRFYYSAKAGRRERGDSKHPTVKPLALMRWLCRLVTPPHGGTVLDPFAGSGTTGEAALREGFNAVLIEREAEYLADIKARIERAQAASPPEPSHPDLFAEETAA